MSEYDDIIKRLDDLVFLQRIQLATQFVMIGLASSSAKIPMDGQVELAEQLQDISERLAKRFPGES